MLASPSLKFVHLVAAVTLSLLAPGLQDGTVIKRAVKVGDVAKFRLTAEMAYQNSPITYSVLLTEKVTKVADDGQYSIATTLSDVKLTSGGSPVPGPTGDQGASQTTYKSTGEIVNVITDITDPNTYRMANLQALIVPTTPVRVGSTWDVVIKKNDLGAVDATGGYKVEGEERVATYDTYRIHGTLKETGVKYPASVDVIYWVNKADGSVAKLVGTWTNAPFAPPLGAANAKVTLVREG